MKRNILLWMGGCMAGAGMATAAPLEIGTAVELKIPTVAGRRYQLETSKGLQNWLPFGTWMVGDGSVLRQYSPAADSAAFWRFAEVEVRSLNALLEPIRLANSVPALGCAVVESGRIAGLGVTGIRKWNVPTAVVTPGDRWHHGSLTKSMTATLAAMLVEQGTIRWESTLAEIFPQFAQSMHTQWRSATLEHLTSNRSGAPTDLNPSGIWAQLQVHAGMPQEARRLLLEKLTVLAPNAPPGTQYEYSNAGFALAGHMLETLAGKPWEELITEKLFIPLGMTTAGFGTPATPRHLDQPWGHQLAGTVITPLDSAPNADNPPGIGPAGTVHCSLEDMARYVAFHLSGHKADTPLLSKASFLKLHTAYPDNAGYAHGWTALDRPWGGGEKVLQHAGSNTLWHTNI